jgi:hypothetical protein
VLALFITAGARETGSMSMSRRTGRLADESRGEQMYPLPTGTLPMTGLNLLAMALAGGALMIAGVIMLRIAYFLKRRKTDSAVGLSQWEPQ